MCALGAMQSIQQCSERDLQPGPLHMIRPPGLPSFYHAPKRNLAISLTAYLLGNKIVAIKHVAELEKLGRRSVCLSGGPRDPSLPGFISLRRSLRQQVGEQVIEIRFGDLIGQVGRHGRKLGYGSFFNHIL